MLSSQLEEQIVSWRRDFHRHPELGFQEVRTAHRLAEIIRTIPGISLQTGVAQTGLVALLSGSHPGPTILVRADMDALPIQELNEHSYRSCYDGVMHACGHDAHMAMQLGAMHVLAEKRDELHGQVKFVFQPAEEGPGGAKPMIEEGVLANPRVDAALGYHIWNSLPVGQVGIAAGPVMANTDEFQIRVQGQGGHGAAPHLSVDSVVVAAHVITALQSVVSRSVDPLDRAVVTVGKVTAGDRHNIIAHTAQLEGTARSFSPEVAALIPERVAAIAEHTCQAFGARCHLNYQRIYPATVNDEEMSRRVWASAVKALGEARVVPARPSMGGEDMSFFLQAVPGCYFFIGSANPSKGIDVPHHHPQFQIDEDAMATGTRVIVQAVLDYLSPVSPH
ncbi:MAG: amidohydrolase [Candidatus Sericytochromatia bacterium]|nr:amidohydrolase [Candidatus Sericytochromatia bacterium]